jgi:hypothetical protein
MSSTVQCSHERPPAPISQRTPQAPSEQASFLRSLSSQFESLGLGNRISSALSYAWGTGSFFAQGTATLLWKSGENVFALAGKVSPFTWTNQGFHDPHARSSNPRETSIASIRKPSLLFSTAYTLRAAWHAGLFGVEFASKIPKNVLAYLDQADTALSQQSRASASVGVNSYSEFYPMITDLNQARRYFPFVLKDEYFEDLSKNMFLDTTAKALYFASAKTQQVAFYSLELLSNLALGLASMVVGNTPVVQLRQDFDLITYFGRDNKEICNQRNDIAFTNLSEAWAQLPTIRRIFADSCDFVTRCYYPNYTPLPAGAGIPQVRSEDSAASSNQQQRYYAGAGVTSTYTADDQF